MLDWSLKEKVGFSAMFSVGSMLDVGWADLIDYCGQDGRTNSIVIYMESLDDPRAFLSAAQEVARRKPIVVIKSGRSEAAARATLSHTGVLAGSDEVLDAVFRRAGVFRVNNIADIFYMAELLSKQPLPKGPRLMMVTNAGGPGVLATDSLIANGGEVAELAPETMEALNAFLPEHWSHNNPIDIIGDADANRYPRAVEIAAKDPALRRAAGDPGAAGLRQPHRSRPAAAPARQAGEAHPGQLDGRRGDGRGRADPQRSGHPDLPLSRYGGSGVLLHVELQPQHPGDLRNSVAAGRIRRKRTRSARRRARSSMRRARRAAPS